MYQFCETYRVPHVKIRQADHRQRRPRDCRSRTAARGGTRQRRLGARAGRRRLHQGQRTQRPRDRRALVARQRRARSGSLREGTRALCRAEDVAVVVGSPLLGAASTADGIELETPHERIRRGDGGERFGPVRRHRVVDAWWQWRSRSIPAAANTRSWRRRAEHGERPGLSAAARLRRRARRSPREDDLGLGHPWADHSLPGFQGRLRRRPAAARSFRRTGATVVTVGDARGSSAGWQRHSRQVARPGSRIR